LVVATVMIGTFMGGLDTYIVNVSLPTIAETFGVAVAIVQWVPLAYLVAITSVLVISGRAADLWGSRRVYRGGLLTFVLGSAFCGAAPTALSLVLLRGLQGLGAAMLLSSGQALLAEVFPEGQLGWVMACMHVAVALGFTLGPSVGGLIVPACTPCCGSAHGRLWTSRWVDRLSRRVCAAHQPSKGCPAPDGSPPWGTMTNSSCG
jgi:MFS family permease